LCEVHQVQCSAFKAKVNVFQSKAAPTYTYAFRLACL